MERVKSIFRRNSERRGETYYDGPERDWVVGPDGVVIEHTTHDQVRPSSEHQDYYDERQQQQFQPDRFSQDARQGLDGAGERLPTTPAPRSGRLEIELQNDTESSSVYAYITGQAIDRGNALFLLSADGQTPYYPTSPSSTGQKIQKDISIRLGPPGTTVHCSIPFLAGGRIWFSIGAPLVFLLNPGPGLVEPSIFNQSDPNVSTKFGFAEFTFNNAQLFANISYVDFVGLPISMTLLDTDSRVHRVAGMPANGLQLVADGLRRQTARDGRRWSSLIVNRKDGSLLRVLSPNSGILLNPTWFQDYWTPYVNQVYSKYQNQALTINTQSGFGDVQGRADGRGINFGAGGNFPRPTGRDIFSCSTGPFATGGNAETNTIIPRLAAAFNRSTLLLTDDQPDGVGPKQYYQNPITNHYARVVHGVNLDGHGYAFPYDDVTPSNDVPQEGSVFSGLAARLVLAVGGRHAHVG